MRKFIIALTIIVSTITVARADAEAHLFKAEELEVQAEVLEAEALLHENIAEEIDKSRHHKIKKLMDESEKTGQDRVMYYLKLRDFIFGNTEVNMQINFHKAESVRLYNEAVRLRSQATIHRRKATE